MRQVYRGPSTHYSLAGLEAGAEYQVRVCAVRESGDGSAADIHGPFSPGTHFSTPAPAPLQRPAPSSRPLEAGRSLGLAEPKTWSDQQWAAVLLLCFGVLAVLVAIVTQQVIAYMGGGDLPPSAAGASAAGSPPPASSHHHHHHPGKTN